MISVVIPCYRSHETLAECLSALTAQTLGDFETVLVDSSPNAAPTEAVVRRFPGVRYRHVEDRLLPHAARNVGAGMARGDILVFSDPDCRGHHEWLSRLTDAHARGHPVVGGGVAGLDDRTNRAIHMVKYGWWLPGGRPGPRLQLPSANFSLTRELWERVGPFREDRWAGDTELSWRLMEAGEELWFEPGAFITHLDHGSRSSFLRQHRARGRDFGLTRADSKGWGRLECLGRALVSPLVPEIMLARSGKLALQAGQGGAWLSTMPFQFLALCAWARGEAGALWKRAWAG